MAVVDPDHARPIAERLLGEFRTLGRLWSQSPEAIERVAGKNSPVVHLLLVCRDARVESIRGELVGGRITPSSPKLLEYLIVSMGALPDETLRVLFVDGSHRMIADEQVQRGTVGQLIFYPRVIFRRALELDAAAIMMVHNHPSGDPAPSRNDILVTNMLVDMGRSLGIEVIEHIIVTANTYHRILCREPAKRPKARPFSLRDRSRELHEVPDASSDNRSLALANARKTVRRRILRKQLLGTEELFGEPAWDMLIDLFIHECEDRPVSTSSLSIASGLPMSTALRLLQRLDDQAFLTREADPNDGRRNFIRLSPDVAHRLRAYFAAGDE